MGSFRPCRPEFVLQQMSMIPAAKFAQPRNDLIDRRLPLRQLFRDASQVLLRSTSEIDRLHPAPVPSRGRDGPLPAVVCPGPHILAPPPASERPKRTLVRRESRALRIIDFVDKRPDFGPAGEESKPRQGPAPGRKDRFEIPARENQFPARNQFARKNSLLVCLGNSRENRLPISGLAWRFSATSAQNRKNSL